MTEEKAIKILERTKRNCGLPEQGTTWKPNAETNALDMAIEALEKKKDNEWIPCSERLPEEEIEVLVTVKESNGDCYTMHSWLQEGVWVVKKTPLNPKVIAWRPLPEPYMESEECINAID